MRRLNRTALVVLLVWLVAGLAVAAKPPEGSKMLVFTTGRKLLVADYTVEGDMTRIRGLDGQVYIRRTSDINLPASRAATQQLHAPTPAPTPTPRKKTLLEAAREEAARRRRLGRSRTPTPEPTTGVATPPPVPSRKPSPQPTPTPQATPVVATTPVPTPTPLVVNPGSNTLLIFSLAIPSPLSLISINTLFCLI